MRADRIATACAALAFAAAALGADDLWMVPAPSGTDLMIAITESKKDYSLMLAGKPWEGANGPERAALPLSKEERESLAKK